MKAKKLYFGLRKVAEKQLLAIKKKKPTENDILDVVLVQYDLNKEKGLPDRNDVIRHHNYYQRRGKV